MVEAGKVWYTSGFFVQYANFKFNILFEFFYILSSIKSTGVLPEDRNFYLRLNRATDEFMSNRVVLQSCIICFWVSFHCLWATLMLWQPTCSSPERGHHHEKGDGADDAHETDTGKDQTKPQNYHTKSNDFDESPPQNTYTPRVPQCMFPRWNWDLPSSPFPLASVPSPRNQGGGGGHTRLRVRGRGSPNSNDWRKA